jgi:precorrin-3B synthase
VPSPPPAPPSSRGPDACPGLLALHPARDGHVARIRLPGGYVTGPRLRALARLARDLGDGHLDLTARGNVQLRGLRPGDRDELARRAAGAGLLPSAAHDRARNIMASPLAGLGGRAPLRLVVRALDAALLADPAFAALPGRFLFSVDDGSGGSGLAACDVGLRRERGGMRLVLAGRDLGLRVRVRAAGARAAAVARAAVAQGVGSGVARVADLPGGGASVAAAVGGVLGAPAADPDTRLPLGWTKRDSGPGLAEDAALVVCAPLGRLSAGQAELIADLVGPGEVVRLGLAGRLVIPLVIPLGAPQSACASASVALGAAGLLVSNENPLAEVTACSGTACRRAVADVRAAAGPLPGYPRTHWAGCARQCGCPPDAEPVIAVDADRYLLPGQAGPRRLAGAVS